MDNSSIPELAKYIAAHIEQEKKEVAKVRCADKSNSEESQFTENKARKRVTTPMSTAERLRRLSKIMSKNVGKK